MDHEASDKKISDYRLPNNRRYKKHKLGNRLAAKPIRFLHVKRQRFDIKTQTLSTYGGMDMTMFTFYDV